MKIQYIFEAFHANLSFKFSQTSDKVNVWIMTNNKTFIAKPTIVLHKKVIFFMKPGVKTMHEQDELCILLSYNVGY